MRAAIAALLLAPAAAFAGPYHAHRVAGSPFSDAIVQPPKRATTSGPLAFTSVSRVIYLNRCKGGCTLHPGDDNSKTDTSSIAPNTVVMPEFPHGDQHWSDLVQCVRDLYAPFNVQITDVDPGEADHFEVMVAGNAATLNMEGAGGVAPFEPCDGQLQDNVISFVFAADLDNFDFMCWAAAQESSHVFGLDHELDAKDPMTYLAPPMHKPGFQNSDAKCGEDADSPRECWCGGQTQNSYQYLMDLFGPSQLEPAKMSITTPADGAWVKPGFNVRADLASQLSLTSGSLQIDGMSTQSIEQGDPLVWNAPATLAGGEHTITVQGVDTGARTVMTDPITVHVTDRCDENSGGCTGGTYCLGGYCLPGKGVAGGLGATCANANECMTNTCASDGSTSLCTGACDPGNTCPGGFSCLDAGGGNTVCWPDGDGGGGGCSTTGGGEPLFALLGFAGVLLIVRRRR